jgi:hypothetical protein
MGNCLLSSWIYENFQVGLIRVGAGEEARQIWVRAYVEVLNELFFWRSIPYLGIGTMPLSYREISEFSRFSVNLHLNVNLFWE